jgi:hypothetical protein
MAGLGRKVFTAGDVLTASDMQSYVMDQTVMNFAGTAARSSAIATPTTGMTTYNQTTQQLETYNGSAFIGMSGLQLVKKQTIGTGVSSVTVSDAFSATYTAYKIIVTGGTANTAQPTYLQLGATATGYYSARPRVTLATGAITANTTQNGTSIEFGYCETSGQAINAEITNPFLATLTRVASNIWVASTSIIDTTTGFLNNTTSYTAFTISSASSWTGGTIYVYGYAG